MLHLSLTPISNLERYELIDDYEVPTKEGTIRIPTGFVYDGASIPSFAWQVIHTPFNPLVMRGAVVHDWLYYTHQFDPTGTSPEDARRRSDEVFDGILKEDGVSIVRRWAIFHAVRQFGETYWANDEEDEALLAELRQSLARRGVNPSEFGLG